MEKPIRYSKKLLTNGGSCAIILPAYWLVSKKLAAGKSVIMEVYDNRIEIRPVK